MVNIIKEELPIEESLRKKLELICEFAKTTPKIINGNIRKIDRTNLSYIEPRINSIFFFNSLSNSNSFLTILII